MFWSFVDGDSAGSRGHTGGVDLNGWVVRDGLVVRAAGRVLVIDGTVWFERPLPRALPMTHPRPAPRPGPHALRAHGVDLDRLGRRTAYPGGVLEGWTALTATWRRGELHTLAQEPPAPASGMNRWTTPPCPAPAAGWPAAGLPARPPARGEWAELTITQVTLFHPRPEQPVLVVAAEDAARAERALRPVFGAALCVVASRYRRSDIVAAQERLRRELSARRWPMTSTGRSAGEDGQPTVTADFAWITPEVAQWAATAPDGLLDPDVWLTPAVLGGEMP